MRITKRLMPSDIGGQEIIAWIDSIDDELITGWVIPSARQFDALPVVELNGILAEAAIRTLGDRPDVGQALGLGHAGTSFAVPHRLDPSDLAGAISLRVHVAGRSTDVWIGNLASLLVHLTENVWASRGVQMDDLMVGARAHFDDARTRPVDSSGDRIADVLFGHSEHLGVRTDLPVSSFQAHLYWRHVREHPSYRNHRNFQVGTSEQIVSFLTWSLRSFAQVSEVGALPVGTADVRILNETVRGSGLLAEHELRANRVVAPGDHVRLVPLTMAQQPFIRERWGEITCRSREVMGDWLLAWLGSWGPGHKGWCLLTSTQRDFMLEPGLPRDWTTNTPMRHAISIGHLARMRESQEYRIYESDLRQWPVALAFLANLTANEVIHVRSTVLMTPALKWMAQIAEHLDSRVSDSSFVRFLTGIGCSNETPRGVEPVDVRPGVAVIGMLDSKSGLGSNARNSVAAFQNRGHSVLQVPVSLHDRSVSSVRTRGSTWPSAVQLIHVNPDNLPELVVQLGSGQFASSYNIGFFAWELDRHPRAHMLALKLVDEIWVPSHYCAASFRLYTSKPIQVMPHAVFVDGQESRMTRSALGLGDDVFLVHTAFDLHSWPQRKNPLGAVRAFQEAFPGAENVALLIKIRNGWNIGKVDSDREGIGAALMELAAIDSRIVVDLEERSYADTQELLRLADCHLSLHRSEGFGYGLAEALLLGVPLVASDYSGSSDFVSPGIAWVVPVRERFLDEGEYYLAPGGARWGEPLIPAAVKALRRIYERPHEARRKAEKGQAFARRFLSLEAMSRAYEVRISELTGSVRGLRPRMQEPVKFAERSESVTC